MLKDVIIRPITEADVPIIHAVALEAWQYTYHDIFDQEFIETFVNQHYAPEAILSLFPRLRSSTICFYVAEDASNIIGFCNIGLHQEIAELYRIYLLPSYIGQGIGQKLLEYGEEFLREHGINTYFCFVHKDNEIGKRFYFRFGFQHVPEKDHDDEWYMAKRIALLED
jgi:ribosomal protein S18 acetylase RimI-like enzyme